MALKIEELSIYDLDTMRDVLSKATIKELGGFNVAIRIADAISELRAQRVDELRGRGELD